MTGTKPEKSPSLADSDAVFQAIVKEVYGKYQGTVWKKPFKLKLTDDLKKGANALEVKVTNLWVNRIIGDAQPGTTQKITFTTMPFYRADSPLLPSGLLGPVNILSIE